MKRLIILLLLLLSTPVYADVGMLMGGVSDRQMPLDALTSPTGAYSFRRLRTAYTGNKAVSIRRASDATTTDIGFTPYGDFDLTTATVFCAATTCSIVTWYDQTAGTAHDLTQATVANQYALVFNCLGVNPCMQATAATQTHISATNVTPATGVLTFGTAGNRAAGTGACNWARQNAGNNRFIGQSAVANSWLVLGSSGSVAATASDGSWHSGIGVINTASSALMIDGTNTTGSTTGNVTAGPPGILAAASTTCNELEWFVWDNVVLSLSDRIFLDNRIRAFWRF